MHHHATARRWTGSLLPFGNTISASKQTEYIYKVMNGVTNVTLASFILKWLKSNSLRHSCQRCPRVEGRATFGSRTQPKNIITEMKLVPPAAAPRLQPRGPSRTCVSRSVVAETKNGHAAGAQNFVSGFEMMFFLCVFQTKEPWGHHSERITADDHCRCEWLTIWMTMRCSPLHCISVCG